MCSITWSYKPPPKGKQTTPSEIPNNNFFSIISDPQRNSGMPPSFSLVMPRLSLPADDIDPSDINLDLGIDTSDLRMTSDADNSDLNSEGDGSDLSEILPKLQMDIPELSLFEPEDFTKFVKEQEEGERL